MLSKLATAKAAGAAAFILFGAAGAAAATNSLPAAAQNGVANAVSHIGVNLPSHANDHARDASGGNHGKSGEDHGKSGDDHGQSGDNGKPDDNHGAAVSDVAHNTDATGAAKGAEVSGVASDGRSHNPNGADGSTTTVVTEAYHDGDHPETTEPTEPTADQHSDGASSHGH